MNLYNIKNEIRCVVICLTCFVIFSIFFVTTGCGSEFEIILHESPGSDTIPLDDSSRTSVIYWSESSGAINCINEDGTGRNAILTSAYAPLDIAVDLSNERIFWTEHTGSEYRISRAGIDGNGTTIVYTASSSDFGPSAISIDDSNGIIYWNEYKIIGLEHNIWYSELSSGLLSRVKLLGNIVNNYAYSICIDHTNGKIYCTANSYYTIGSIAVAAAGSGDTGAVYTGHTEATNNASQVTSLNGPSVPSVPFKGLAVDGEGGHVYYVNNTAHGVWPKNITRTDLDLLNPEVWVYQGVVDIQKIAVDLEQRKIYWTSESDKSIYRADLDSSNSNVEKFINLENIPTGIAISR